MKTTLTKKVTSAIQKLKAFRCLDVTTKLATGFTAQVFLLTACTGEISGTFRYAQQVESFNSHQDINTKIDLLWVVDNSSSMDVSQSKLRSGFQSFAAKYMKPTWDIRVAVITTDTYLANPAFSNYLNTTVSGSVGYTSAYLASRLSTLTNPSWNPNLINLSNGSFPSGFTFKSLVPAWGSNYAKLLAGNHDGPISAFCFEPMPYFINGVTQCKIRDDQTRNVGTANCVSPNLNVGESSLSQCVNTIQNDSVHSGKPIISTMPPAGVAPDATWTNQLVKDFMVNASTGSSGSGSERGISSVLQLLSDNETSSSKFFRANALRGIIFLSDEDDQSMRIPSSPPAGFKPFSGYGCDQTSLISLNGTSATTGSGGTCCTNPANNCSYPTAISGSSVGTTCASKTIDGYTFNLTLCADQTLMIPVAEAKAQMDSFFLGLDGAGATDPNYFVSVITPTTAAGIQSLQASRATMDGTIGVAKSKEVNRGDRYIALGKLVSADSLALDITSSDYSPILDAIGQQIIAKKSTFTLTHAPTVQEEMILSVKHADGSYTVISASDYTIKGNQVIFTNENIVLGFASTDQIVIDYQPKSALSS